MRWKISFILFLVFLLSGCAPTKNVNRTKSTNTIQPKESAQITDDDFQVKADKLKQIKETNSVKLAKIEIYEIGKLTEEQFFADGWNPVDSYMGIIGITEITGTDRLGEGRFLELKLGLDDKLNLPKGRITEEIQALYNLFMEYQTGTPRFSYTGPKVTNAGKSYKPDLICTLSFKNKTLEDIKWAKD